MQANKLLGYMPIRLQFWCLVFYGPINVQYLKHNLTWDCFRYHVLVAWLWSGAL